MILSGFLENGSVQTALVVGAGAAIVSAVAGVFAVLRGQAFAGHALADVSSAGGALAFLLGVSPMLGFFGLGVAGALGVEAASARRAEGRDLAAGIVLGAGLGLTALLLYLDVTVKGTAHAASAVMFGSIFAVPRGIVWWAGGASLAALGLAACIYRPLLLVSLDEGVARAAGVDAGLVSKLFLLVLAVSVTLSAMVVGAILSTALLIGPAAAALRLARRPWAAMGLAALFGLGATWGGVALAYASYGWPGGHVWPVSFFVTFLVLAIYAAASVRR